MPTRIIKEEFKAIEKSGFLFYDLSQKSWFFLYGVNWIPPGKPSRIYKFPFIYVSRPMIIVN